MSSQFSASRSLYSQIHSFSNAFGQGWLRGDVVTVTRSVRDIDEDKSRLFTETYQLPSGIDEEKSSLYPVKGMNFEAIRPVFQDISPSGNFTLSLRQGGKSDEIPLIQLNGAEKSHYLDASEYHGKFVGDSWFGGVSWSHDERFVAYVAFKKENEKKKSESSKYFEYRSSEPDTNKFEYIDDWGEKYVGLVSLSLNVLDTISGEISTVEGIDDNIWTVGQPMFLPPILNENENNYDNGSEKKNNECILEPSYRLSYTSWKNGPKKLGMIYCYQRECSIFVVDLTDQLITPPATPLTNIGEINTGDINNEILPGNNLGNLGPKTRILVTPGVKLARSARFSPNGRKMIFLGSKKGFSSHSGCSELLSVEVEDIIKSLNSKKKMKIDSVIGTGIDIESGSENVLEVSTIIPTIVGSCTLDSVESSTKFVESPSKFPGIYSDQLPKNCFLTDDLIIMTTPWGSVETMITVELSTKKVEKVLLPCKENAVKSDTSISGNSGVGGVSGGSGEGRNKNGEDYENNSCSILDINRVKMMNGIMSPSTVIQILLVTSSPSFLPIIGVLTMTINNDKNNKNENKILSLNIPSNYKPNLMPITRKKLTKKAAPTFDNLIVEKVLIPNLKNKKENKENDFQYRNLEENLQNKNNFNDILDFKITKYFDENGIPFESILVMPKNNNKNLYKNNENTNISDNKTTNLDDDENDNINTPNIPGVLPPNCPLIVVPHGGPHSCMTTTYIASYAFLSAYLGAAVLHVNFRGSTGFGQDSIDALLGQIGTVDVADMLRCTLDAVKSNPQIDEDKVAVVGGSHGGFLAAHMIGQYPDVFKVACMRNPVVDIPGMLSVTDIPDWCYVEALGTQGALKYSTQTKQTKTGEIEESEDFNTMCEADDLLKMRACSPIIYVKNVRAPVLMLIGGKDRRVPMSQGVAYYHTLKAKGIPTKLLVFPEDVHAIDRPLSEAEQWIAIAEWLETHLL